MNAYCRVNVLLLLDWSGVKVKRVVTGKLSTHGIFQAYLLCLIEIVYILARILKCTEQQLNLMQAVCCKHTQLRCYKVGSSTIYLISVSFYLFFHLSHIRVTL